MQFADRVDAGKKLAKLVYKKYGSDKAIVYALPRGGVVTAVQVTKKLHAKLALLIPRKIGHPTQPEYAIAAVTEDGKIVGNKEEIERVDREWFEQELEKQLEEAKRRRRLYAKGKQIWPDGKTAIIVDDGIATGLTMQAAIAEVSDHKPKKIVLAVPVGPQDTIKNLSSLVDDIVVLFVPKSFYAIGEWYESFPQVTDEEVVKLMQKRS